MSQKKFELSNKLYFIFIDSLRDDVAVEYVETDPDNIGGTRNTEKGMELFDKIESALELKVKEKKNE
jgi:hypothetical protein